MDQKSSLQIPKGGCLGIVVASSINSNLGLSPKVAVISCSLIGVAIGYVVSIFIDIFSASTKT